jgi:hypothetical protein
MSVTIQMMLLTNKAEQERLDDDAAAWEAFFEE